MKQKKQQQVPLTIKHGEWEIYRTIDQSKRVINDGHQLNSTSNAIIKYNKCNNDNCTKIIINKELNKNNKIMFRYNKERIDQQLLSNVDYNGQESKQGQKQTNQGGVDNCSSKLNEKSNNKNNRLHWIRVAPLIKRWLPFIQLFKLTLYLLLLFIKQETNCDHDFNQQQSIINLMPDLIEDYQSLNAQLNQQKSFDYLTNHHYLQTQHNNPNSQMSNFQEIENNLQEQQQQQQQQQQEKQLKNDDDNHQQNLSIEELLDSQSSAAQPATTSQQSSPSSNSQTSSSSSSSSSSTSSQTSSLPSSNNDSGKGASTSPTSSSSLADSSTSTSTTTSTSSLTDQLSALTNLLQHIGIGGSSTNSMNSGSSISDSLINGVTNNILEPIRSQTTAMGNIVRKTINAATSTNNNINHNHHVGISTIIPEQATISVGTGGINRRPTTTITTTGSLVGQGINGNIEYDSENNSINGNIEWPSFGNGTKPSFSTLKPFLWAALKTVPIKLGSVGWKLLQLIAWKKIYKTHHPKSGEIVIEQEVGGSDKSHSYSDSKSLGKSIPTKSVQLEISGQPMMKTSKMGQAWPMGGGGGGWKMSSPYGGGPMGMGMAYSGMPGGSPGGWPLIDNLGGPMSAHSMIYQRHLLPPQPNHSATAAAAAAAATAAAIQSQWVQNQIMNDNDIIADYSNQQNSNNNGQQQQRNNSKDNANNQQQNNSSTTNLLAAATKRKRSSPTSANNFNGLTLPFNGMSGSGNWFATPAHAYAAAAAAAATATATAVSQQQQHNPLSRFGLLNSNNNNQQNQHPFESAVSHDGSFLAGLVYQNLFDNAAAMAVQNVVKLPNTASLSGVQQANNNLDLGQNGQQPNHLASFTSSNSDFLEQADSLPGSSLTLGSSTFGIGGGSGGAGVGLGGDMENWSTTMGLDSNDNNNNPSERSDAAVSALSKLSSNLISETSQQHQTRDRNLDSSLPIKDSLPITNLISNNGESNNNNYYPNSLASMPDFDDTPAGKMLDDFAISSTRTTSNNMLSNSIQQNPTSTYHFPMELATRIG